MDLLLEPKLFEDYFNTILKVPRTELDNDLNALFNNVNNRFVISLDYINYLEESNKDNPTAQIILETFLSNLINFQSYILPSINSIVESEILDSLENGYNSEIPSKKKEIFLVILKTKSENKVYSVNLNAISKPNKNWILFKLSCYHPVSVTLRHFDFVNNNEINELFKNIFSISQSDSWISIFDKQANLTHSLFNSFNKKSLVHYYTSYGTFKESSVNIKANFTRLKIFTGDNKIIHERKICKSKLVCEADDDFWNLTVDRPTWKIDITYCHIVGEKIKEKSKKFKYQILK